MQYIKYYEKITVVARIWGIIKRFRVLILSVIGACLALTSAFLGVRGCVYDVITCPETVSYGDSLTYDAAAFFRDVRYEYSEDAAFTTVWSTPPKYPGEYYVRAVSTSSFGKTRYGQIHAYTILPKNIDVRVDSANVPYGDLPTVAADLPYDDIISCDSFIYADPTQTKTAVTQSGFYFGSIHPFADFFPGFDRFRSCCC